MICDIQVGPRHVSQYYGVFYSPILLDGDMNSWSGMLFPRMRVLVFQIRVSYRTWFTSNTSKNFLS